MDPAAIPLPAWQQAAIVVLFIVFLGAVFVFIRWVLHWTADQSAIQRTRWEEYTTKRDKEWRDFFTVIHQGDTSVICDLKQAIETMTRELTGLRDDLHDHDAKVEQRIAAAADAVKPTTRRKAT